MQSFTDKTLTCTDCGKDFIFSAGEQQFFQQKRFTNLPKRCKPCKAKVPGKSKGPRCETSTLCAECGDATTVPFKPINGTPVLCRACFQKARASR